MKTAEQLARQAIDICGGPDDVLPRMVELIALVRAEAFEEAANVCEDLDAFDMDNPGSSAAAAIRALSAAKGDV